VPAEFQFAVKLPKSITHEAKLVCGLEILSPFLEQIACLGKQLGPVLVQLPPGLQFDSSSARQFLAMLRQSYSGDVVWEPRHASWFEDRANGVLREYQIARVAADPACVRAAADPGGAEDLIYFRLHGSPRRYYSSYDSEYLNRLALRLDILATRSRVWCIFDNTASGAAVRNALELESKVLKRPARGKTF
jgi:uncharacterized protein YecE (DUF72 family)